MKLADLIREDSIVLGFTAADKWKTIEALVDHLIAKGRLPAAMKLTVLGALVARENLASTGMEHGVALPHTQVEGLTEAVAAFAVAPNGVEFACADGKPATLIALLVIPRRDSKPYVRTLAGIARLLNAAEMRAALRGAKSPAEVVEIIRREEAGAG